ncbi:hypothetical protein ACU686_03110 [Yinghuangia aomiensis]
MCRVMVAIAEVPLHGAAVAADELRMRPYGATTSRRNRTPCAISRSSSRSAYRRRPLVPAQGDERPGQRGREASSAISPCAEATARRRSWRSTPPGQRRLGAGPTRSGTAPHAA